MTIVSVEKRLQGDACHDMQIVADALTSDCADTGFNLILMSGGILALAVALRL